MERTPHVPPGPLDVPSGRHLTGVVGEGGHRPEADRSRWVVDDADAVEQGLDRPGTGPGTVSEAVQERVDAEVGDVLGGRVRIDGHSSRVDNARVDRHGAGRGVDPERLRAA